MPKATVLTMGCKVNQFDSAVISEALESLGYELARTGSLDVVVLNACVVTERAEAEALRILRRLRRENPEARLVVVGCLAKRLGSGLLEDGLADMVSGTFEEAAGLLKDPHHPISLPKSPPEGEFSLSVYPEQSRSRAFLKIQEGCSASCAYCLIPRLRGRPRSLGLEAVLQGIRHYQARGFKEIVLTGIHLGHWGADLLGNPDLRDLLLGIERRFLPQVENFRLRLSSIEPTESELLLDSFQKHPWLAPHLHIPLQSGCGKTLTAMNRPYTPSFYRDLVLRYKNRYPKMAIGTDIIVGFPGETREDFYESLDYVRSLPLSYHHVFPFSERSGTKAYFMEDKVGPREKRERAGLFKEIDLEKRTLFQKDMEGHKSLLLVESSRHLKSGRKKAVSGNYLNVLLKDGAEAKAGCLYEARLSPPLNPYGLLEAEI